MTNHLLTGDFFPFFFFVFLYPDMSLLILFSKVEWECFFPSVCCVSPIKKSCLLRAWAWMSVRVEQKNEWVCLSLSCNALTEGDEAVLNRLLSPCDQPSHRQEYITETHTLPVYLPPFSLNHTHTVSTVHPLATAQGSGGEQPPHAACVCVQKHKYIIPIERIMLMFLFLFYFC